jgi:DNA-binding NarL/FixJ family response regulator
MRVILVGSPEARARLRADLSASGHTIAGEAETLTAARAISAPHDAYLVASDQVDGLPLAEALTVREREVLDLVAEGLPNKAIATRLNISDQTVKFHVASIAGKLGASNRTEAVWIATRRGLITI